MDNFDLKKYLAENKLLKEGVEDEFLQSPKVASYEKVKDNFETIGGRAYEAFLRLFPKGEDISKSSYLKFTNALKPEGQEGYYNRANWIYLTTGDFDVYERNNLI